MSGMKQFQTSSKIKFTQVNPVVQRPMLQDVKVGETFIRNGAVCMAVRVCHDICGSNGVIVERTLATSPVSIINLQTGSVWTPDNQKEEIVPVKMTAQISQE